MIPRYEAMCIHLFRKDVKLTVGKTYDVLFYQNFHEPHQISIIRDDGREQTYNAKWFLLRLKKKDEK